MTVVCGDSHTSTHGAFGALAFGIGTSEVEHVLATQTLPAYRPKTMAIEVSGELPFGVTAKDLILAIIAKIGTGGGQGHIVEYRGQAIRDLSMEGRMTVCNMSIEAGARAYMIAPDETTFEYLKGRRHAPSGEAWDAAVEYWKSLRTDDDAAFDTVVEIDATTLSPFVTWGTNPGQERRSATPSRLPRRPPTRPPPSGPSTTWACARAPRSARSRWTPSSSALATVELEDLRRGRRAARPHGHGPHADRPGFDAGQGRRGGRGPSRGVQGLGRRVARGGLLDVPGHEPRHPRPWRAQRVHLQPQLRGPPGQGRAHPPRVMRRSPPPPP